MPEKRFWLSKTFWMNLILPILAFFVPTVSDWIVAHPKETALIWGGINIILRFITKGKVVIS